MNVKGYLKNITTRETNLINTKCQKINNKIKYKLEDAEYEIVINKEELYIIRTTNDIKNIMHFKEKKQTTCDYTIKKEDIHLQIELYTGKLQIENNKIFIRYQVEGNDKFEYNIEIEVQE